MFNPNTTEKAMVTLDELEKLAKAATPGPWSVGTTTEFCSDRDNYTVNSKCPPSDSKLIEWPVCEMYSNNYGSNEDERTAKYIASCSPATILKLIEAHRVMREALSDVVAVQPSQKDLDDAGHGMKLDQIVEYRISTNAMKHVDEIMGER